MRSRRREGLPASAFLNIPYDRDFQDLYLAYIAGLTAYGLTPRATLEIPGGERRLDRIVALIRECQYSFHDLTRVEIDTTPPPTPRFNMPFELGLTIGWMRAVEQRHTWFALETQERRVDKSLSDLKGTDVYVHGGTPGGVFREIGNALVRSHRLVTVAYQRDIFDLLTERLPGILKATGARSCFEARVFRELSLFGRSQVMTNFPVGEPRRRLKKGAEDA